jgi:hypothetical protein
MSVWRRSSKTKKRYEHLPQRPAGLFDVDVGPLERAHSLVSFGEVMALGMLTLLRQRVPLLKTVTPKHWDFIVTVAGVFIATVRIRDLALTDAQKESVLDAIRDSLRAWRPDGIRGFEDCKKFFDDLSERLSHGEKDDQYIASDALGAWIVWNVLGRRPQSSEEIDLVRTVGLMLIRSVSGYWR